MSSSENVSIPSHDLFISLDSTAHRSKEGRRSRYIPLVRFDGTLAIYQSFDDMSPPLQRIPLRLILSDITFDRLSFFSISQIYPGFYASITLPYLNQIYIRGRVSDCREVSRKRSRVLSEHRFRYRVGMEYTFNHALERQAIAELIESLFSSQLECQELVFKVA